MKKICILALACTILTGCFGGRTPDSKFYLLNPIETNETNVLSKKQISIAVEQAIVPEFLDRPQIVTQEENSEIKISELNRWAEPLSDVFRRAIIEDMQQFLPNAFIKPKQYNDDIYNYTVIIEINQMIAVLGEEATLDVWWSIKDMNGNLIERKRVTYKEEIKNSYESYISAESQMVGKLAKNIAQAISK